MTANASSAQSNTNQATTKTAAPKIAIIGGGLTGLFTAALLEKQWAERESGQIKDQSKMPQITIFEKSRSVGRLATRYRSAASEDKQWQWAFGAQFFTAKTEDFANFIQPWLANGLLQPWLARVVDLMPADSSGQTPDLNFKEQWDTNHARYISTPKMTSWGRALADNLQCTTINFKTRVAPLAQYAQLTANKPTELFDDSGVSLGAFDWVVCTTPNGQALDLMADSGFSQQNKILQPTMLACYTLMLGWDDVANLPKTLSSKVGSSWDVAYLYNSPLAKIFIEHQKSGRDELLPSVTIHASNEWSEQRVDDDIKTIQIELLAAAKQALNWYEDTAPSQIDCHRWRYAATVIDKNDEPLGILVDEQYQWIVSGDWCGQGNIESCYQMAAKTVEAIMVTTND
ncbi:NAD(P)/FAD-dependent oxidoreductase [uncultured Psychrobacter sp.]|uniref:NAD(P)/FAD-dependent oxidoreductase n=1 Tax=uncultured Psychrobacter sp. TaxID=259303 RepID=UPI00345A7E0F